MTFSTSLWPSIVIALCVLDPEAHCVSIRSTKHKTYHDTADTVKLGLIKTGTFRENGLGVNNVAANPAGNHASKFIREESSNFDYYVFTQLWPVSNCETNEDRDCVIPSNVTGWTVHGLWPSNFDGSYPQYCDDGYKFNDDEITSIWGELVKYWTNLFQDSKPDSFWEHEWEKHGTCAFVQKDVSSEKDYFDTGLKLNAQYQIAEWLWDAGVRPDNTQIQNAQNISSIIQKKVNGKKVTVECGYDQKKKEHILSAIEICLDRSLEPIDCQEEVVECKSDGKLLYPKTVD